MRFHPLLLIAAVSLPACDAADPQSPDEFGPLVSQDAIVTVVERYFSGITEPTTQLITTSNEWSRVWAAIHRGLDPEPELPAIDFSREALVLVALGSSNGTTLRIDAVRVFERGVVAETVLESWSERCLILTAVGQPVHVVRIARPSGQAVLVERTHRIRDCD